MTKPKEVRCSKCNGNRYEVCDACFKHSCWEGVFMCEDGFTAGTVNLGGKGSRS